MSLQQIGMTYPTSACSITRGSQNGHLIFMVRFDELSFNAPSLSTYFQKSVS